ncbi:MAG TPA: glycerophosphodiester phosphodiesterase family protein, partial [Pyrinomonadaceae bacterium]
KQMGENVLVASFWHPYLREYRSLNPEVATSASAKELIAYLRGGKRPKADAIQIKPQFTAELKKRKIIRWSVLTEEFLRRAHRDNLPVHAWTINDGPEMLRIKDLGVDGIITDYPKRLLDLVQRPAAC